VTQDNKQAKDKGALRVDQNTLINNQGFSFSGYERDPLYLNLGGKKFKDISGVSGIDSITDGRAGVFADFDNDGDLDVFMTTIQGEAHLLFRNNVGQANNFLRVSLEGGKDIGPDAFGSVVRVKTSHGIQTKIKSGGSGFISQHDPRLLFGLGKDERSASVEVTWSNGKVETFESDFKAGSSVLLKQGTGKAQTLNVKTANLPDPLTKTESFARGLKIAVGKDFPNVQMKTLDGKTVSVQSVMKPGRKTLINIWATWCVPCATEMPELEALRPRLAQKGIDLIGISVDVEKDVDIKGFVKQKRVTYPIYAGGVPVIEQLYATDVLSVPMSILIDEKGKIIELTPGWSSETQKKFEKLIGEKKK
jgi:thiol-disulfide isomerase/thioredoxin